MDPIAQFMQRHGLPPEARLELEAILSGASGGLSHLLMRSLPDSHADSTLMFDPEEMADEAAGAGVTLDSPTAHSDRYQDLAHIGRGAFAEVRRVRDKALNRVMAMKILERRSTSPTMRARFVQEAQATAQLQHPGIVPVHELGVLPDGRMFFTMEEVRGRTLSAVVDAVHRVSIDVWAETPDGWTLRRLLEVFRRITEAVAYAHSRGVVHRDLKPANVMVGTFGEVRVMDWGIAKILGSALATPVTTDADPRATRDGLVAGTPAFMAPEQARGEIHRIDRRTDVYALGSILYYILCNRPPYDGSSSAEVLIDVGRGEPVPLVGRRDGPLLPSRLVDITLRAMHAEPEQRYPDAQQLAADVAAWLDGAERRASALRAVGRAAEARRDAKRASRRAAKLRAAAQAALDALETWSPAAEKAPAWEQLDEADRLERQTRAYELAMERELNAAFAHEAELPEGHLMMARTYQQKHELAEASDDTRRADRFATLLREHLDALPPHWPGRDRLAAYLAGDGRLQLDTTRPCEVTLYRFEPEHRRLVPRRVDSLGRTPVDTPLPMGSYLLELEDDEGQIVLHPLRVRRQQHLLHQPPDATEPQPLRLPIELEPDEAYVPEGWFEAGGDERAPYGLPRRRLWCDAFAIQVFPVTHADWLDFLAATGSDTHAPRDDRGRVLYTRDAGGRWTLDNPLGEPWRADAPVVHISWHDAEAYAAWRARRDGLPWRLPFELEWEKAARGVDGRAMPWGDEPEPAYCNLRGSLEGPPRVVEVDRFPTDVSVYGIRGLGGNTADWCADAYTPEGPVIAGDRVVLDEGAPDARFRNVRGGSWRDGPEAVRSASRWRAQPDERSGRIGLRLARSVE